LRNEPELLRLLPVHDALAPAKIVSRHDPPDALDDLGSPHLRRLDGRQVGVVARLVADQAQIEHRQSGPERFTQNHVVEYGQRRHRLRQQSGRGVVERADGGGLPQRLGDGPAAAAVVAGQRVRQRPDDIGAA
jgi:hypothetical protein